jgi:uridine kinase
LIAKQLSDILEGKEIDMPVYNFKISKRENFCEKVKPANLIIFEGILSLYDRVIISIFIISVSET